MFGWTGISKGFEIERRCGHLRRRQIPSTSSVRRLPAARRLLAG
jgi:hypothetical protein